MNDTPRVTVPVEPTLPFHPESTRIAAVLRAEAERRGKGVPTDLPGLHKDLWTAAEIIDMAEQGRAFDHQVNAMLSAAPAPEGGAVDEVTEADAPAYLSAEGAYGWACGYNAARAALATREEAPAEAGEIDLYDDKVQAGIAWTMRQWGETLGLKTWDMGDGSESVEGDVGAEIHTILVDAGLRDPETNEMASLPQASDDDQLTAAEAWSDLLDKDDRTSPEDQPEMCLITAGELADYMARAQPPAREEEGQ